MDDSLKRMQWM